jgi:hypothetical protein
MPQHLEEIGMSQSFVRRAGLAAAVALSAAVAGAAVATVPVVPKTITHAAGKRYDARRSLFGGIPFRSGYGRRARPGWSNRKVQRMAAKRRNVTRHRRASR